MNVTLRPVRELNANTMTCNHEGCDRRFHLRAVRIGRHEKQYYCREHFREVIKDEVELRQSPNKRKTRNNNRLSFQGKATTSNK